MGMPYDAGVFRQKNAMLKRHIELQEQQWILQQLDFSETLSSLGIAYGAFRDHQKRKALLERSPKIKERHYGHGTPRSVRVTQRSRHCLWKSPGPEDKGTAVAAVHSS